MAQYNLVRNGYFTASGDYTFTTANLNTLQDGTFSGTGVTISGVNTLTLNLSQRIKIDNIRLYANDLTKSSNIYFWYKNSSSASYTQTPTYVSDYYYTTIPDPSAPMYVKVTISGVPMTLYEFYVDNDDYIVAFGEDGQLYDKVIDNTVVGSEGSPQAIPIYNNNDNSSMPVNSYTCVEPTGSDTDDYIELSSSYDGSYYKVSDGLAVRTNKASTDIYKWADGTLSNTSIHSTNDNVYVTTTLTAEVDLGSIPLTFRDYSWSVGSNCWDYDPVNRVIYAIGAETTSALKLYKRYIDSGGWVYMGQINMGVTGFTYFATMCYLNGYVYVICNLAGTFGRYNVNGATDNWQTLSGVGWSPAPHYIGMCSDKNRYIYAIHHYHVDDNNKQFRRYDTTTSGWAAMNNGYVNTAVNDASFTRRACLAYDYDRNYIYADIGGYYSTSSYIQRYSVSGNSWNTTWFNVDTYTNATNDENTWQTHTYYNNVLVLGHALTTGRLYYYNLSTGSITYIAKNTEFYKSTNYSIGNPEYANPYILATDIPTSLSGTYNFPLGIAIYASQMATDRGDFRLLAADNTKWGTYTSPVFRLDDKNKSSYFTIKNTGNVSYDADVNNGTIRVRSSDTEPLSLIETYVGYQVSGGGSNRLVRVARWIPYTNSYTALAPLDSANNEVNIYSGSYHPYGTAMNQRNGYMLISNPYGSDASRGALYLYDRDIAYIAKTTDLAMYRLNRFMEFDGLGYLWGYGDFNEATCRTLYRFREMDLATVVSYSESQQDFIQDMTTDYSSGGCWYINKTDSTLVHMSDTGYKIAIISMNDPICICKTTDNGCWVYDADDVKVHRYDASGNRVASFDPPYMVAYGLQGIGEMSHDYADGLWFRYENALYHANSLGMVDVGPVTLSSPALIRGTKIGCLVHSTINNYMYFINMSGQTQFSRAMPTEALALFGQLYYGYDDWLNNKNISLPLSYDPVWGGSTGWTEVQKEGYFLSKNKYHQVSTKLWDSATLDGIYMAPAIEIDDIGPHQSKNLYVRTNIPEGADITDYTTNLRSWWSVED